MIHPLPWKPWKRPCKWLEAFKESFLTSSLEASMEAAEASTTPASLLAFMCFHVSFRRSPSYSYISTRHRDGSYFHGRFHGRSFHANFRGSFYGSFYYFRGNRFRLSCPRNNPETASMETSVETSATSTDRCSAGTLMSLRESFHYIHESMLCPNFNATPWKLPYKSRLSPSKQAVASSVGIFTGGRYFHEASADSNSSSTSMEEV